MPYVDGFVLPPIGACLRTPERSGASMAPSSARYAGDDGRSAGDSITITIQAALKAGLAAGSTVSNQATVAFDADGDGTNEKIIQNRDLDARDLAARDGHSDRGGRHALADRPQGVQVALPVPGVPVSFSESSGWRAWMAYSFPVSKRE
jgi:hypothetical protein